MAAPARAAGRAIWNMIKEAGRIATPDNPTDLKDAFDNIEALLKVWMKKGSDNRVGNVPATAGEDLMQQLARIPVIDPSRFIESNRVKLAKALVAAGAVYGIHILDTAARHRLAKERGLGLFAVISVPAAVPIGPSPITQTRAMMPSEVALEASLLAGPVCPGLLGHASSVSYSLPPAIPGTISAHAFLPAGFAAVVLLPCLASLFEE